MLRHSHRITLSHLLIEWGSDLPRRGRAGASVELSSEMLSLSFSLTMCPHVADAPFLGFGSSCRIQCLVFVVLYSGWLRFQLRESVISCSVPVLTSTHILCKWGYFDFLSFLFVPFCLLPFSYCSNKTSSLILNKNGESRHLCPATDLSGNASRFFSPLNIMLAIGSSNLACFILKYVSSTLTLFRTFSKEGY